MQAAIDYMLSAEAKPLYDCLVTNSVAVTPTLVIYPAIAKARAGNDKISKRFQKFIHDMNAIAKQLHDSGVLLLSGTDVSDLEGSISLQPGISLHDELHLLEEAGIDPRAILKIATINPANAIGVGDQTGSIAVKKDADFLILTEDPGKTVANLRKIEAVYKLGELVAGGE